MVVETSSAAPVLERLLTTQGSFGARSVTMMAAVLSTRLRGAVLFSVKFCPQVLSGKRNHGSRITIP